MLEETIHGNQKWFALQVNVRQEKTVATLLRQKGYEELVPTYRCWSSHRPAKGALKAIFPGYVFARFDERRRLPVLMTPGVTRIVGAGKTPIPVSPDEIEALLAICKAGLSAKPYPFVQTGDLIKIMLGPLRGLKGTIVRERKQVRVVVSVHLLQRSVAVDIPRDWVVLADTEAQQLVQRMACKVAC